METTGRQALEARVLELEMRVPNLVALQERIDNVELSIARLAAIEEQVASGPLHHVECRDNGGFYVRVRGGMSRQARQRVT